MCTISTFPNTQLIFQVATTSPPSSTNLHVFPNSGIGSGPWDGIYQNINTELRRRGVGTGRVRAENVVGAHGGTGPEVVALEFQVGAIEAEAIGNGSRGRACVGRVELQRAWVRGVGAGDVDGLFAGDLMGG